MTSVQTGFRGKRTACWRQLAARQRPGQAAMAGLAGGGHRQRATDVGGTQHPGRACKILSAHCDSLVAFENDQGKRCNRGFASGRLARTRDKGFCHNQAKSMNKGFLLLPEQECTLYKHKSPLSNRWPTPCFGHHDVCAEQRHHTRPRIEATVPTHLFCPAPCCCCLPCGLSCCCCFALTLDSSCFCFQSFACFAACRLFTPCDWGLSFCCRCCCIACESAHQQQHA